MIEVIYELKRKKWKIEFEWDLYWNIIDYRFSKKKLILNIFGIKRSKRQKIEELKLKLNEEEYMIYEIELYINFKRKELKKILNYEYISKYDRIEMKMKEDLSEWICFEDNEAFVDELYKKENSDWNEWMNKIRNKILNWWIINK